MPPADGHDRPEGPRRGSRRQPAGPAPPATVLRAWAKPHERRLVVEVPTALFGHGSGVHRSRHRPAGTRHVGSVTVTIASMSATERHSENVEKCRGGRIAARASVVPGWSTTNRSTGLPHRRKRGSSGSLSLASVTTGSSCTQLPDLPGRSGKQASAPKRRRKSILTCHPSASAVPSGWRVRKRSSASSSSHRAKYATRRTCIRWRDTVGEPSCMRASASPCSRPGTSTAEGGCAMARMPTAAGSSARW